jgi:hypothetical protein
MRWVEKLLVPTMCLMGCLVRLCPNSAVLQKYNFDLFLYQSVAQFYKILSDYMLPLGALCCAASHVLRLSTES